MIYLFFISKIEVIIGSCDFVEKSFPILKIPYKSTNFKIYESVYIREDNR